MSQDFSKNIRNPETINERIHYGYDGNVELTGEGYVQVPSGETSKRPSFPEDGMVRYNTTTGGYEGYSNGSWGSLGGGGGGATPGLSEVTTVDATTGETVELLNQTLGLRTSSIGQITTNPGQPIEFIDHVNFQGNVSVTGSVDAPVAGFTGDLDGNVKGDVYTHDGAGIVLRSGATPSSGNQLYNTTLYNSTGNPILTVTSGQEHFNGDISGDVTGDLKGDVYTKDGAGIVLRSDADGTSPNQLYNTTLYNSTGNPILTVASGSEHFGGDISSNGTSDFSGTVDFTGATVTGLSYAPQVQQISYFYDSGSVPGSTISGSSSLGRNHGTMYEMTFANRSTLYFGPGSTDYDPTITNITFDSSTGKFSGFEQNGSYLIMVNMEMKNDGTGSGTLVAERAHDIECRSGSNVIANTVGVYAVLPDSVYGGTNYTPWPQSVNMQVFATFEDATPANNTVEINLNSNQSQYYYANYGYVTIIKMG